MTQKSRLRCKLFGHRWPAEREPLTQPRPWHCVRCEAASDRCTACEEYHNPRRAHLCIVETPWGSERRSQRG